MNELAMEGLAEEQILDLADVVRERRWGRRLRKLILLGIIAGVGYMMWQRMQDSHDETI